VPSLIPLAHAIGPEGLSLRLRPKMGQTALSRMRWIAASDFKTVAGPTPQTAFEWPTTVLKSEATRIRGQGGLSPFLGAAQTHPSGRSREQAV